MHVDNIIRVQKIYRQNSSNEAIGGKRHYSTSTAITANETNGQSANGNIMTALTSLECKHVNNTDNLIQWFIHRKHTCGSLRMHHAGQMVGLVGWIDKKQQSKFVHLTDGYGNTQILLENNSVKSIVNEAKEGDLLLIYGRVLARPKTHVTHNSETGDIELYADQVTILNPDIPYEEAVAGHESSFSQRSQQPMKVKETPPEVNINEFAYRSHNCGELTEADVGKEVTLCGWLEFSRMKRFLTLRDGYGQVQVIVPDNVRTIFLK